MTVNVAVRIDATGKRSKIKVEPNIARDTVKIILDGDGDIWQGVELIITQEQSHALREALYQASTV